MAQTAIRRPLQEVDRDHVVPLRLARAPRIMVQARARNQAARAIASSVQLAMSIVGANLFAFPVTEGYKITILNPLRTPRFAKEELERTKTDA